MDWFRDGDEEHVQGKQEGKQQQDD